MKLLRLSQALMSVGLVVVSVHPAQNSASDYNARGVEKHEKGDSALADYTRAIDLDPKSALAYYNRGLLKKAKGDLDGALADYTRAIEFDPKNAKAYVSRGFLQQAKGYLDGALADYTRAIELDPKDAKAYTNRGLVKQTKGDLDGAMGDYTRAIELDPKDVLACYNRGILKKDRGDLEGALADYTRAIELDPKFALFYNERGNVKYVQGLWNEALADFRKAVELSPSGLAGEEYAWLRIWLLRARLGGLSDLKEANKELADYLRQARPRKEDDWYSKIARFLIEELSEADFLKAADSADEKASREQRCEAYFYAGTWQLIHHRTAEAREHFQKCLATGVKTFAEYQSAQAELKRLEKR